MKPYRDAGPRNTKQLLGLVVMLLVVLVMSSGCKAEGTATYQNLGVGSVRVSQEGAQSTDAWAQNLSEYGLYYSTNRADVVNVDQQGRDVWLGWELYPIILRSDVPHVRIVTYQELAVSEFGTGTVDLTWLKQGERYYFRWYGIAQQDSGGAWIRSLTSVTSHVTLSHDASLKSIKTSRSRLVRSFLNTRYSYTVTLPRTTGSTKITVAPTRGASKVQMKIGSGSWSTVNNKTVSVSRGKSKTVYIRVTATDGSTVKNYKVRVSRRS